MRLFDLGVLPGHHLLHRYGEIIIECFPKFFDSGIFAPLAFSQNGMVITLGDSGFQVNPAAMQCTGSAAAHFGLSFIWTLSFAAQLDSEAGLHGFDKDYFVQQVAGLSQLAGDLMLVKPTVTLMLVASVASAALLVLIPWQTLLAEPTPGRPFYVNEQAPKEFNDLSRFTTPAGLNLIMR